jgi:hypothetical protein
MIVNRPVAGVLMEQYMLNWKVPERALWDYQDMRLTKIRTKSRTKKPAKKAKRS